MASSTRKTQGRGPFRFPKTKAEWRPPYAVQYAPLFVWPPRPLAVLKWLAGYPGFLVAVELPVPADHDCDLVLAATRAPALCHVPAGLDRPDVPPQPGAAVVDRGRLAPFALHLQGQGTERKYDPRWLAADSPRFLFRSQLYDNIFWSCASGCTVWTAYEAVYMWAAANGHVPLVDWSRHPIYCAVWLCAIPFWREFHFYWIHRAIHWKPLYRLVHYLHHKNVNPGPWSGLAMHPLEHVLYFSVLLIHWVVPSHPIHLLFNAQHTALTPAGGHHGFEGPVLNGKLPTGSYFHYLHHRYYICNFGEATLPLDKCFGHLFRRAFARNGFERRGRAGSGSI